MTGLFKSAFAATAIAFVILTGSGAPQVHAAAAAPCTLTPVLLDTTVNQGLQSYPQLVRGKETLVRFYFGLPSCAVSGNAIQVNSAQLTVRNQSASGVALLTNVSALAPIGTATPPLITSTVKQIDATGDPKWVVNLIGPTNASFNSSFEASLAWQSKTCATCALSAQTVTPFSIAPGTRSTLITKTVAARTNAARLLIVPMGLPPVAPAAGPTLANGTAAGTLNGTYTYRVSSTSMVGDSPLSIQSNISVGAGSSVIVSWPAVASASGYKVYRNDGSATGDVLIASLGTDLTYTDGGGGPPAQATSAAQQTLQNALTVLSRGGPFSDSGGRLGDLAGASSTAGIRFTVNTGFIDLSSMLTSGQFCGNNTNFGAIDANLASILRSFNGLNPTNPADKVIGVVDGSLAIASAVQSICFEGEASPGGVDAWIRLAPSTPTSVSLSGAVLAEELGHTWGIQPFSRSNGAYHSIYTTAHATTGDPGKTYNVLERMYVRSDGTGTTQNVDRTALVANINANVSNSNVIYENADWNDMFCFLGGPIPTLTGSACTSTSVKSGTAVGVPASAPGPAIQITAHTDGTKANTDVVSSFADDMLLTGPDPNSNYHIVERDSAGNILLDFRAPVSPLEGHSGSGVEVNAAKLLISASVSRPSGAVTMELWNGAPSGGCNASVSCLFSTTKIGNTSPTIQDATTETASGLPQLKAGTATTLTKTINIAAIPKTPDPKPDVYLLADTTGSMSGAIGNVKASATDIVNNYDSKAETDPCFGVGSYRDFGEVAPSYVFNNALSFTDCANPDDLKQKAAALNQIGAWDAVSGGDIPEAQLYALHRIAQGDAAFRDGSQKTVIWFGDAPGHEPICGSIYAPGVEFGADPLTTNTLSGSINVADELKSANVKVFPIGVISQPTDKALDADPASWNNTSPLWDGCPTASNAALQASRIADATGGVVTLVPATQVSESILKILNNDPATVVPSKDCQTGIDVAFSPTTQTAITPATMSFTETVTIAATAKPGTYTCQVSFSVNGTVNPDYHQTLSYDVTSLSGPHTIVEWTATDDSTGPLHGDVAIKCNGLFHILKANVVSDASGKFLYDTTRGCAGGAYYVTVNDGWFITDPVKAEDATIANKPSPPNVSISSPTSLSRILQFGVLAIAGSGKSFNGPPLAGTQLQWKLDGNPVGTGGRLDLTPGSAAGWGAAATNTHTLTLTGTDSFGIGTATLTFTTLGDNDDDGVSSGDEVTINGCQPGGALPNPDSNPYNATGDNDGDGLPNASDPAPCTAQTDFEATALMIPARLNLSSPPSVFSLSGIFSSYIDLKQVPKSQVRITKVAGIDVSGPEWYATGWVVSGRFDGTVGVASFTSTPLVGFLNAHPELLDHTILVTISGTTGDGAKSFHADAAVYVYKSG